MVVLIPESLCDLCRKVCLDGDITSNWNVRLKIRNENVPSFLKSKLGGESCRKESTWSSTLGYKDLKLAYHSISFQLMRMSLPQIRCGCAVEIPAGSCWPWLSLMPSACPQLCLLTCTWLPQMHGSIHGTLRPRSTCGCWKMSSVSLKEDVWVQGTLPKILKNVNVSWSKEESQNAFAL